MPTHYQIIEEACEGVYKEKGSKFYSYCLPVKHVNEVAELVLFIKSKHPKARHHCYAYRLGLDGLQFRSVDAGEPSGTAGKPILGQIDSAGITDTLIIVVRYFGGTLLGASGLIKAYKESAADAIRNGNIIQVEITRIWRINFDFSIMGQLLYAISELQITLLEKKFDTTPYIIIRLPSADSDAMLDQVIAKTLRVHQEIIVRQRIFNQLEIEEVLGWP